MNNMLSQKSCSVRTFVPSQLVHNRRSKWTKSEKDLALSWTIKHWLRIYNIAPGVKNSLMTKLHQRVATMTARERECDLLFDEKSIKKSLEYNAKLDLIEGFQDFGEFWSVYDSDFGIDNWVLIFFIGFIINFILQNYLSYGIIKNPTEITNLFIGYIQQWYWICTLLFICYTGSSLVLFANEKLLALNVLPEKYGFILQIFTALATPNYSFYLFHRYSMDRVVACALAPYIFLSGLKQLSFVLVNMNNRYLRLNSRSEKVINPEYLTFKKLFYFIFDTNVNYDSTRVYNQPRDIKKIFKSIFVAIIIHYLIAFIVYQYIIPERVAALVQLNKKNYIKLVQSFLGLILPLNLCWLLYFYCYLCKIFFPLGNHLMGTVDVVYSYDWWNSSNFTTFWIKWNHQVHLLLKNHVYATALQWGCSKRQSTYTVGLISGVLHEYLVSGPLRSVYGLGTVAMLLQIPAASVSKYICEHYGERCGNLFVWSSLIIFNNLCIFLGLLFIED
ncbi:hypothetical protein FQR65_LT14350 [Abscondita terminalis]|nr:hypothetical protein FQR65_LT14350 [Abscondita terminalis]